ncbi:MAG: carboxypeptidase-like regulatory domain-containing protein [Candidatus Aenigmatarchaeota archaeon]
MKRFIFLLIAMSVFLSSCIYAIRYDGPYRGKVVEAETGEPIEGVVVLGVWYTVTVTPAGGTHNFYDATETVTDKNGEFKISGKGLRILSNLEPMQVTIFKVGYEYLNFPWDEYLKEYKRIKWEGSKAIIPLRKLTMEERRRRYVDKETIPDNKQQLLIKELNKEYKELGIPLYPEEN